MYTLSFVLPSTEAVPFTSRHFSVALFTPFAWLQRAREPANIRSAEPFQGCLSFRLSSESGPVRTDAGVKKSREALYSSPSILGPLCTPISSVAQ